MKVSKIKNFFLLTGFFAYLLVGIMPAQAMVWCIGSDCGPRVEKVLLGSCDSSAESCSGKEDLHHEGLMEDHCGDCLDLEVFSDSSRPSPRFSAAADLPAISFLLLSPPFDNAASLADPHAQWRSRTHSAPSRFLLSLRTTVLRN